MLCWYNGVYHTEHGSQKAKERALRRLERHVKGKGYLLLLLWIGLHLLFIPVRSMGLELASPDVASREKNYDKSHRWIILMVTKDAKQLPQRFRVNSGVKIHQCQFAPSVAAWVKVDLMEDDWGRHYCWKQIINTRDQNPPNTYWQATKCLEESPLDRWHQTGAFGKSRQLYVM